MRRIYLTVVSLYACIALIPLVVPGTLTVVSLLIASALTLYYLVEAFRRGRRGLTFKRGLTELSILMVVVPIALAAIVLYEERVRFPSLLNALLAFGLTLITWNYMLMSPLAVYHKYRESQEVGRPLLYRPLVSVIVPARNEERTIGATIESILETDYEPKEIIVVDDASTDRTFEIASRYVSRKVRVLRREHGGRGKASALNFGVRFARGDVIVVVDADTLVGRRSITELVRRFQDPEVSAVSGNVLVRNKENLLTKLQAIEYILSFNFARRAMDVFGAVMIISGSFGGFRREVLFSTGMYDPDVVTEDFDITIKALKTGKIVQASSLAVAFTEVPRRLRDLYKQRMRWYRGAFEVLLKHRDALFNLRYGYLQRLVFPALIMQLLVIPVVDVGILFSLALGLIHGRFIPLLMQFALFSLIQLLIFLLSLQIAGEEDISLAILPLFVVGYKQMHEAWMIKALIDTILARAKGKRFEWGELEKEGLGLGYRPI